MSKMYATWLVCSLFTMSACDLAGTDVDADEETVESEAKVVPRVTVARSGDGAGDVLSTDGAVNCGSTCTAAYRAGTLVTLTASPRYDSRFVGWQGADCPATGSCTFRITTDVSVNAVFALQPVLRLDKAGNGMGSVSVPGLDCNQAAVWCSQIRTYGETVAITATPAAGSTFTGWGGACSGTSSTCTLTLTADTAATATFTQSVTTACNDGVDNDGDGFVDYLGDPGCSSTLDTSEKSPSLACDDGIDNDGDSLIDFPADPSCTTSFGDEGAVGQGPAVVCSSVSSMVTDTDGGAYYTWIGAWSGVTAGIAGDELGILLPFDEPNTSTIETQYYYQRGTAATPSVLAIGPSNGGYIPEQILTLQTDAGAFTVYMPAMTTSDCVRTRFYVARDGSTYHSRADHDYTYSPAKENLFNESCFGHGVVGPDLSPEQAMVPQHLARAAQP